MSDAATTRRLVIRDLDIRWGSRTYCMGILNLTPDSFSGDGLADVAVPAVLDRCRRMVDEGADLVDLGAESTRPGHAPVSAAVELARLLPVLRSVRSAFPGLPVSIDTRKPEVAEAALDAGADVLNDVSGVTGDGALATLAGERRVPYVLMHDRPTPTSPDLVVRVVADLVSAVERAVGMGCPRDAIIVDPGIGFGKDAAGNLALLRDLPRLHEVGLPVLLGASRKSTIGRVLDLPAEERLEGTLATTVLGVAARVDVVRVHDVRANVRAARMADAVVRGWSDPAIGGAP
ncbi:MAG: dihydropteroate synthase [Candidatus Limnocylindrales bacterium]